MPPVPVSHSPVTVGCNEGTPSTLEVVGTGGSSVVPRSGHLLTTYGWADDSHVVARRQQYFSNGEDDARVVKIDIRDGSQETLSVLVGHGGYGSASFSGSIQLTDDLLGADPIVAVEPPRPPDPRVVAGIALALVVLAGWALIAWRRRVTP